MAEIKEALEFYANEDNHDYGIDYDMCEIDESEVMKDYGKKAKAALSDPSKVKGALEFYANEDNYEYYLHYDMCEVIESEVMKDYGGKAQKALVKM